MRTNKFRVRGTEEGEDKILWVPQQVMTSQTILESKLLFLFSNVFYSEYTSS